MNEDAIRTAVHENYANVARTSGASGCCGPTCCSKPANPQVNAATSVALGYSRDDVESVPEGANMGLGCGNPVISTRSCTRSSP